MKSLKEKIVFKMDSKTVSICISVFAILLLIIAAIVSSNSDSQILNIIMNIIESCGVTLLSVGLISIIMEISTIESIVKKALNNVLTVDFPIDAYSDSHLNKLKTKVSTKLLNCSENHLNKSIYKLEPNLLQISNGLYYEYHKINCTVTPNDNSNIFTKNFKIEYKIINRCNTENKIKLGISLYDLKSNMSEEERLQNVRIKKFLVNNVNLLDDPQISISIKPLNKEVSYEYDYVFIFERPLQKCREHKVELEYEYNTLQTDLTQSWKLRYPCKKTEHIVCIRGRNDWSLKVNAFASFFNSGSELENNFKVEQNVETHAKVEFDEWTIPGAGYVVLYNKK